MPLFRQLSVAALAAIVLLVAPVASNAQDTTSAIRGKVLNPNGAPVEGATVVVEDTRSGVERTYRTNNAGNFLATRLLPGGPYSITVDGTKSVSIPSIGLGDTYGLTINMQQEAAIEEIIAIGQAANFVEVASGPAATFSIDDVTVDFQPLNTWPLPHDVDFTAVTDHAEWMAETRLCTNASSPVYASYFAPC